MSPNNTSRKPRVAIVGGAIGGCLTALALRDIASTIVVIERAANLSEMDLDLGGGGITLFTNSVDLLSRSDLVQPGGLTAESLRVPSNAQTIVLREWYSGKETNRIEAPGEHWSLHRRTFITKLYELVEQQGRSEGDHNAQVEFIWNVNVRPEDVDTLAGTVKVGNERVVKADIIVGADGVKSAVRRAILRASGFGTPKSVPIGFSVIRFNQPDSCLSQETRRLMNLQDCSKPSQGERFQGEQIAVVHGPFMRSVHYRIRDDGLLNSVVYIPDDIVLRDRPGLGRSWRSQVDGEFMNSLVDKHYAPMLPGMADMYRQADGAGVWQLRSMPALPTWSHGKAIIIGDAAHPMAPFQGSGTSMVIEDIEALRLLLKQSLAGPPAMDEAIRNTFDSVYKVRFLRASIVQTISDRTPFQRDVLDQKQRASLEMEGNPNNMGSLILNEDGMPLHEAYSKARKRVEEAVEAERLDLDSPIIVQWAMVYTNADEWQKSKESLILDDEHDLWRKDGPSRT
ncbi:FAD/NAD(P)-binding domain-containing protein [Acaromyces ingoldii]|uniref:FAD/NAD(P)-binding domain-containing protein n=1 Tax=Acaromyces ingoldii TaxID=215250 RepID=A0A316YVA6_9BASI|nr:FAD/NAD(P)-binding domain-containing protein [Acaromyces ingoldii]PWN93500.1 FAD/NAD(P)-binding domain-containing protein [Acaromyces ingoldii]